MIYVVVTPDYVVGVFTVELLANNAADNSANARVVAVSAMNAPGQYGKFTKATKKPDESAEKPAEAVK